MSKKALVLLCGNGVYDGSEIHESVLSLLALEKRNIAYFCTAPDVNQHHVINHTSGEEMPETRNVLVESARIARGEIKKIQDINSAEFDALVMPGGFGAAKNLTKWAFSGPDGDILPEVKDLILDFVNQNKPIVAVCMSPTVIAKALEGSGKQVKLTVGTNAEASPYEIEAISQGMEKIGAKAEMKSVVDIAYDEDLKIITSPCYMMEAGITQINEGLEKAMDQLSKII